MKINAVMNIIKKRTAISLYCDGDTQWIASGDTAYNISALPELTAEQLLTLMGIPEKKKEDYMIISNNAEIARILDKSTHINNPINRGYTNICIMGEEYEPVIIDGRAYFINTAYFKPFDGIEWDLSAWINKQTKEVLIAVKAGFLTLGIIRPSMVNTDYIALDLALLTETIKRQKELDVEITNMGYPDEDDEE